jgi:predicted dinucleotide-binding enzyme
MRYAVLGTGVVGRTLGTKLVELGHEVTLGSRAKDNPGALQWAREAGAGARAGTFEDAASTAEVVVVAVGGRVALAALEAAGAANLDGKVPSMSPTPSGSRTDRCGSTPSGRTARASRSSARIRTRAW